MIYYVFKENKVYGCTEQEDLVSDIAIINNLEEYEIGTTNFEDYEPNNNKYILQDGLIVLNPNYEAEQEQQERERIAKLSLTRGDVFRGLLLARGVTRLQLRGMIESNEQLTEVQKEMALIDFDEALNFYRGNALIDTVGLALGIEPAQLDCFFETNDYTCLLPKVEPVEEVQDDSSTTDTTEPDISI